MIGAAQLPAAEPTTQPTAANCWADRHSRRRADCAADVLDLHRIHRRRYRIDSNGVQAVCASGFTLARGMHVRDQEGRQAMRIAQVKSRCSSNVATKYCFPHWFCYFMNELTLGNRLAESIKGFSVFRSKSDFFWSKVTFAISTIPPIPLNRSNKFASADSNLLVLYNDR